MATAIASRRKNWRERLPAPNGCAAWFLKYAASGSAPSRPGHRPLPAVWDMVMFFYDRVRVEKMWALPTLPRVLFDPYAFDNIDPAQMAPGVGADITSVKLCLAEARGTIAARRVHQASVRSPLSRRSLFPASFAGRCRTTRPRSISPGKGSL